MVARTLDILIGLFALFALVKFAFFFVLDYATRRRALDRAYRGRSSATTRSDAASLVVVALLVILLAIKGVEATSFLTGLLVGMTLIQLYFHRFSAVLSDDEAPPPPHSPIKLMSYAIQAAPGRSWRELILMTVILVWSLYHLAVDAI